tara:strand:+ start:222 stop:959 length:738 start_codon:yes stop_codon:yes gene_type:complete
MRITTPQLKRIIFEEYLKEEGITLDEDKSQELLDYIKGKGPKPDWYDREESPPPSPPDVPAPDSNETYPMDIPSDDATEREYKGFQKDSGPDVESQLAALIQGMEPETVAKLFQSVFEKIPGVELSSPGDEDYPEEVPGTEYVPGAMGRPVAGFQLENLTELIREALSETKWFDIASGETAPPHSTGAAERQEQELVPRIQKAYHDLQDVFEELPDEIAQEMGREIISRIETLMDTTEYPEDYRE